MTSQNNSHAVMSRRYDPIDSADDFPTHPWAVRGFCNQLQRDGFDFSDSLVWEPACGRGHMAQTLAEFFPGVWASDKYDYGFGERRDFLEDSLPVVRPDWIITNPPFNKALEFVLRAISFANQGVAVIVRSQFSETIERYNELFHPLRPSLILQSVERIPMHRGRLLKNGSTASSYMWMVWDTLQVPIAGYSRTDFDWIPPCRREYQTDRDYSPEFLQPVARIIPLGTRIRQRRQIAA